MYCQLTACLRSPAQPADALLLRRPLAPQLWPFWCEMMSPSHEPWLYPHVPAILDGLKDKGVQLAVRWGYSWGVVACACTAVWPAGIQPGAAACALPC